MKRKFLLGSIGAVASLILVSFSSVVNVQSTTSDSFTESPLFNVRTNKAIDNEHSEVITTDYLGKGINSLSFPLRDNKVVQIQKIVERIKNMNNTEFKRFQSLILSCYYKQKNTFNIDANQLISILQQLRTKTKGFDIIFHNDEDNYTPTLFTGCVDCYIFIFLFVVFFILFYIVLGIISLGSLILRLLTVDIVCPLDI